ncbi:putrescine aminotransferase [Oxobacter pfennigii]|uniref:Putrescine aminotransferase n=1 Tax=Oxobacter pfennigii TaxID=36849 RepID=A0A0N8NT47_9CLOT|nr:aminotransferase class III-fold pyridoxal phosphate-dependent enzyme [Oxobacter pfennigii]KPU43824.1 putrescine aminotransferase [Oxobacter pfennigii]
MHKFSEYVNPYLGSMLEKLKIDKSYVRGEGSYLFDCDGIRYLDCIASYGALPFGYNHPEIKKCIDDYFTSGEPSLIQPSALNAAGDLAEKLIEIAPQGLRYVTFTNSGAETVEAAIKLCRAKTGRMGILAACNSFHGKTLGALSATGKDSYQSGFGAPAEGFHFVEYGDLNSLEKALKNNPKYYSAFIIEPIQGEGGIVEPPECYLKWAKELCGKYGVFLIVDEIQTGLGRTGAMFASEIYDVFPDVLLLSKALGGGIIPIGACISTEEVYNEKFAMKHSSTFAANSLACRVGIKVIELLEADNKNIIKNARACGSLLKEGLINLQNKYPEIIKSVRGRGLMLGMEFNTDKDIFPGSLLGIMAEQELLTPVISSYLLNNERIRVAPTLNGNMVIRIEPPLNITQRQCVSALNGIERMLKVLQSKNTGRFLTYLTGTKFLKNFKPPLQIREEVPYPVDESEGRFAFLVHPIDLKNYTEFDKSLSVFNPLQLKKLADTWNDLVEPFVISKTRVVSAKGKKAYGEFIVIPKTAEQLMTMPKKLALDEIKKALAIAKESGAQIVGLGAYTSVVSGGGLYIKDEGIPLTTGNSYTAVCAAETARCALERLGRKEESSTAAIIGAAGSIGRGVSLLLSESISNIILIGNSTNKKSSFDRLYIVAAEIYRYLSSLIYKGNKFPEGSIGHKLLSYANFPPHTASAEEFIGFAKMNSKAASPVVITADIDKMLNADVVISATSSTERLITPGNLKERAIVCDMSRPSNVSEDMARLRPDVVVIDGGIIEVPGRPSLGWDFGFEKGLAYACMSETMMLALEHRYENYSLGASGITLDTMLTMRSLAYKHGFKIAGFMSFNKPLHEDVWLDNKKVLSSGVGAR